MGGVNEQSKREDFELCEVMGFRDTCCRCHRMKLVFPFNRTARPRSSSSGIQLCYFMLFLDFLSFRHTYLIHLSDINRSENGFESYIAFKVSSGFGAEA